MMNCVICNKPIDSARIERIAHVLTCSKSCSAERTKRKVAERGRRRTERRQAERKAKA